MDTNEAQARDSEIVYKYSIMGTKEKYWTTLIWTSILLKFPFEILQILQQTYGNILSWEEIVFVQNATKYQIQCRAKSSDVDIATVKATWSLRVSRSCSASVRDEFRSSSSVIDEDSRSSRATTFQKTQETVRLKLTNTSFICLNELHTYEHHMLNCIMGRFYVVIEN